MLRVWFRCVESWSTHVVEFAQVYLDLENLKVTLFVHDKWHKTRLSYTK